MRWRPGSPGALTRRPTNHASGAGQYSVTVNPRIHLPWPCVLGVAACLGASMAGGKKLPPPERDTDPGELWPEPLRPEEPWPEEPWPEEPAPSEIAPPPVGAACEINADSGALGVA